MDSLEKLLKNEHHSNEEVPFEHFDKVVDFIEKEQMRPALQIMEKSFSEGICDVRFIFYVFYANFLEKGILSLEGICPLIVSLVNEHSHRLVPLNKRDIHLHNSLNWFFSKVLGKLKHGDRLSKTGKKHPFLEKALGQLKEESLESFIKTVRDFQQFFHSTWPSSPTKEKITHLVKKVEEMRSLVLGDRPQEKTLEEEEVIEDIPSEKEALMFEEPKSVSSGWDSELMNGLIKKMKIFEELIGKGDYLKAALIAKDISYAIEHFDPCAYFPQVFSKHLALMTQHISEISDEWSQEGSLKWGYLDKLYKTDIEQFISLK